MNECMNMSSSSGEGEDGTSVRETQEEELTGFGDCLDTGNKRERSLDGWPQWPCGEIQ